MSIIEAVFELVKKGIPMTRCDACHKEGAHVQRFNDIDCCMPCYDEWSEVRRTMQPELDAVQRSMVKTAFAEWLERKRRFDQTILIPLPSIKHRDPSRSAQ